jgi:hypothetical protein
MGHCPGLPAGQFALALFADRIRTGIGRAGAVLRLHPACYRALIPSPFGLG